MNAIEAALGAVQRKSGKLSTAQAKAADTMKERDLAITQARHAGAKLRDIGKAAELSHQAIANICGR